MALRAVLEVLVVARLLQQRAVLAGCQGLQVFYIMELHIPDLAGTRFLVQEDLVVRQLCWGLSREDSVEEVVQVPTQTEEEAQVDMFGLNGDKNEIMGSH